MTAVDGAIVIQPVTGGRQGSLGIRSVWSGGAWQPGEHKMVRHFRARLPLGVWRIQAVEVLSRGSGTVLWLEPLTREASFREGDVLVLGDGRYSVLEVQQTSLPTADLIPVELGRQHYHALFRRTNGTQELFVFHESDAALDQGAVHPIWYRDQEYQVQLAGGRYHGEVFPVEMIAQKDAVPITWMLKTLGPIRGFALDAGQEILFRRPRKRGGRRLGATYEYFEPQVMALPGSMHLSILPAEPVQIPLFISPDEPLRRLGKVLEEAASGNSEAMLRVLSEDLFSTDELLKKVRDIADTAIRVGGVKVRTPDSPDGFLINRTAHSTVVESISSLETRTLRRQGLMYALDTIRSWCRVLSEDNDGSSEDWTLRFDKGMTVMVEGKVPREVMVEFETQARQDVKRGTGYLIDFVDFGTA